MLTEMQGHIIMRFLIVSHGAGGLQDCFVILCDAEFAVSPLVIYLGTEYPSGQTECNKQKPHWLQSNQLQVTRRQSVAPNHTAIYSWSRLCNCRPPFFLVFAAADVEC